MKKYSSKLLIILGVLLTFLISANSNAMSKNTPVSEPAPSPVPSPTAVPTPKPEFPVTSREPASFSESLTPTGFNVFAEVADPVGAAVDLIYNSYRELREARNPNSSGHKTDFAAEVLTGREAFSDRISFAVETKFHSSRAQLGYVYSYFGLAKDVQTYAPNSLISHPLCKVTASSLKQTLGEKKVPSTATIEKVNRFADKMNEYRRGAIKGTSGSYVKASKLWSKFMMCLSYTESLTTADTMKSKSVGIKYAPSNYQKPNGVKFYEDPAQSPESRLNIGLFQFTPTAGGNIQACIREWNLLYPNEAISQRASQSEMIRIVGSSLQTFNAFCGVAKLTGMFSVQINTNKVSSTHPANLNSNGSFKSSADRCVTPHFTSGKSYNHFGPFQNSTGSNLEILMKCTMSAE